MGTAVSIRARSELSAPFLDDRESAVGICLRDRLQRLRLLNASSAMWQDVLPWKHSKGLPLVSAGAALRILASVICNAGHECVRPTCCACACHAYTFHTWRNFAPLSRGAFPLGRLLSMGPSEAGHFKGKQGGALKTGLKNGTSRLDVQCPAADSTACNTWLDPTSILSKSLKLPSCVQKDPTSSKCTVAGS